MTSEPGASKSRLGPTVPPSPTPGDNRKDRPERAPRHPLSQRRTSYRCPSPSPRPDLHANGTSPTPDSAIDESRPAGRHAASSVTNDPLSTASPHRLAPPTSTRTILTSDSPRA